MNLEIENPIKENVKKALKEHKYYNEGDDNVKNKKAVGSEDCFTGIKINGLKGKEKIHTALNALIPNHIQNDDVVYLCIGTDRSTGDSLALFVGTYLKGMGYKNVHGTIDEPVHAMNLTETIEILPKDRTVIAIDACLGQLKNVGFTQVIKGSIKPGAGVNKKLPKCGDYAIAGIVNVGGFMEYTVLQNTRLSLVVQMAKDITSAIIERFPLEMKGESPKKARKIKDEILVKKIQKQGLNVVLVKN